MNKESERLSRRRSARWTVKCSLMHKSRMWFGFLLKAEGLFKHRWTVVNWNPNLKIYLWRFPKPFPALTNRKGRRKSPRKPRIILYGSLVPVTERKPPRTGWMLRRRTTKTMVGNSLDSGTIRSTIGRITKADHLDSLLIPIWEIAVAMWKTSSERVGIWGFTVEWPTVST